MPQQVHTIRGRKVLTRTSSGQPSGNGGLYPMYQCLWKHREGLTSRACIEVIRARIEHVFGAQETAPGGRIVCTIGIVRARVKIGLQNFVYNVRRLATLERRRSLASFNLAGRLAAA